MTTMTGSEWLLYRAFATVEVNCSKACWQKNIRTGYEVSRSYHPGHMSRDERLGSDGNRHRDLREQLDPFWFAVLEIRYGDNPEKIRQALKSIAPPLWPGQAAGKSPSGQQGKATGVDVVGHSSPGSEAVT